MVLRYKVYTNIGNREVNEDSVGDIEAERGHMFVVADGLGGHGHGEVASAEAVKTSLNLYATGNDTDVIGKTFVLAQKNVMKLQEQDPGLADMKTTMVSLIIENDQATWGHIGDSRLYFFRKGKLKKRTLDHSVPQMLVSMGEIKPEEIRGHDDRNRLLRVIGSPWESRSYEIAESLRLKKGDAFLLCTDGFWELIEEKIMQKLLKEAKSVEEWLVQMIDTVNTNGIGVNMDNNSAIAIWVDENE